jgi:hypothetical protein
MKRLREWVGKLTGQRPKIHEVPPPAPVALPPDPEPLAPPTSDRERLLPDDDSEEPTSHKPI